MLKPGDHVKLNLPPGVKDTRHTCPSCQVPDALRVLQGADGEIGGVLHTAPICTIFDEKCKSNELFHWAAQVLS